MDQAMCWPELVQVIHKGYASLLKASQRRGDNIFNLPDIPAEGLFVHEQCRRVYNFEASIMAGTREKKVGSFAMYKTYTNSCHGNSRLNSGPKVTAILATTTKTAV